MASYFNQSDIDEFGDCVGLFAKDAANKHIGSVEELTIIMRSLGFSPTSNEITNYYNQHSKDGIIDFATFLEIMHIHSQKEKCQQEIQAAFRAQDVKGNGTISGSELSHVLTDFGERLSKPEVDRLFKEANLNPKGQVKYKDIIDVLLTPLPDYRG